MVAVPPVELEEEVDVHVPHLGMGDHPGELVRGELPQQHGPACVQPVHDGQGMLHGKAGHVGQRRPRLLVVRLDGRAVLGENSFAPIELGRMQALVDREIELISDACVCRLLLCR